MKKILMTLLATSLIAQSSAALADSKLLNVSYDPTRELYEQINPLFIKEWAGKHGGEDVTIRQSHGGSGKQARAVIDGLSADVVTLALAYDIDAIAEKSGKVPADWQNKLPHHSTPFQSTIVFLVRKGNPKQIHDWEDLVKSGVQVITPNPKTSGGARWNYLAAWAYADKAYGHDEVKIKEFMTKLFANVPVLDTGARGATTNFVQRELGDVLIAWENEAKLALEKSGADKFEIVTPSLSILAEPPVAVVETNAKKHNTLELSNAYLQFLYSKEAQEIGAKNFYRPTDPEVAKTHAAEFPVLKLVTIEAFGGWKKAQTTHFNDGGTFDTIYGAGK